MAFWTTRNVVCKYILVQFKLLDVLCLLVKFDTSWHVSSFLCISSMWVEHVGTHQIVGRNFVHKGQPLIYSQLQLEEVMEV
jgi:hypothetical protein